MTKNNKNLLIKCKSPMALKIQEAADSTSGEKEYTFEGEGSRLIPLDKKDVDYILVNRKVILPSEKEIEDNPRSKSAKLRIIERK